MIPPAAFGRDGRGMGTPQARAAKLRAGQLLAGADAGIQALQRAAGGRSQRIVGAKGVRVRQSAACGVAAVSSQQPQSCVTAVGRQAA